MRKPQWKLSLLYIKCHNTIIYNYIWELPWTLAQVAIATAVEEGSQFRGAIISQQEKFTMVKIESYGGLLKWGGFSLLAPPFLRLWLAIAIVRFLQTYTFYRGDQNWQRRTSLGCQNWSSRTDFGSNSGPGEPILANQFFCQNRSIHNGIPCMHNAWASDNLTPLDILFLSIIT